MKQPRRRVIDSALGLALGHCAGLFSNKTGYMANLRGLCGNFRNWQMSGIPLTSLSLQDSKIASQSVDCRTYKPLKLMKCELANWASSEKYRNPGPIQVWHSSNQVARFH